MKTQDFEMTIICSIILFITWSFSVFKAIRITKVPGHYVYSIGMNATKDAIGATL